MDKIGYEHESSINYLTIQSEKKREIPEYQIKMLIHNEIQGLLDFSIRNVNNKTYYYYNITSVKPLSKLYGFGKMTWEDVVLICESLDILTKAMDKYMLDINCVLIRPEYMYLNISEKEIKYVYCPGSEKEFHDMLKALFEFILEHYEYGTDKKHQMQIYEIYQKIAEGDYKIHYLSELTKDKTEKITGEDEDLPKRILESPQKQEEVVITDVLPESVMTEEEIQPWEKIKAAEVGICICAVVMIYIAASLVVPEKVLFYISPLSSAVLIIISGLVCSLLYKCRKKWKEIGEIKQITKEKEYSFVPEEEEIIHKEKEIKKTGKEKEVGENNTILLSEYLKQKNADKVKLMLQNQEELESDYDDTVILDVFPCAIGNMAAYCSVVIHSELISRIHACVYKDDSVFYLEDMNSTNGTFLNGKRLSPKDRHEIKEGDLVGFANLLYKVEKS